MRIVFIRFSKSKHKFAFFGDLIRLYMKTEYSHVSILIPNRIRDLVYESVGKAGIRLIGTKKWNEKAECVYSFPLELSESEYASILGDCIDSSGTEYAFWQNLGIVICETLHIKRNIFKKGMNCSEAIAYLLKDKGITFEKEHNLITPKDIFNKMQSLVLSKS